MTTETSNARGEWVLERLRGVLEHGKMGDKCLIAPDLVTAAIAALSAQQSPAEAQPVAKLVNRKDADGGKTTTFIRPTSLGMDLPLGEYPLHLHPPPSAPVGVERIAAEIRASLGHGATVVTRRRWAIELEALAQQPAAVDEGMVEQRARELLEAECGRPLPLDVPVCAAHSAVVAALSQQAEAQPAEARGVVDEGSRSVTRQLLHWDGVPVHVTGTVTTSPGNWSLIDAALATQHREPTTCKHDFRRDEDHGGACCQLCGEVRQ